MKKSKEFLKEFFKIFNRKEIIILPANLAYFFFISVVPIATIMIYVATSFSLSFNIVMRFLKKNISSEILSTILPIIDHSNLTGVSILILLLSFFIASNGARSIIIASNTVFNIENKSYFYRVLKGIFITLILIVTFLFLLVVPIFGESILKIFSYIGIKNQVIFAFNLLYPTLKYPLSMLFVFLLVKLVYIIAPDEKIKSKFVNKGALFTTIGWVIISAIYSIYINTGAIKTYNIYYGSLASIIIVLLWFYLMAYIFVIGLVLNYRDMQKEKDKLNIIEEKKTLKKIKPVVK